jgi:serine/threonine-protein kinase RsbW
MPEVMLTITCRLENLAFGSAAARAIAADVLGAAASGLVEMAVTEVCSNIVRHGHPDAPGHEFTMTLRGVGPALEIEIRDIGPAYSFERRTMPPVDVAFDELPEGGFGIALVHETMDVVEFRRVSDVNIVRLVKRADAERREP